VIHRISLRYLSAIGSGEDDQSLASGVGVQKIISGSSYLEQVTHYPSAYRGSRGQENRDTSSLETPGRSGPSACSDTWWKLRHRESGYRHSHGKEIR